MPPTSQLTKACLDALEHGRFDKALQLVQAKAAELFWDKGETQGKIYSFPEGDHLCREIGRRFIEHGAAIPATPPARPLDIYLASEIYQHGGHTALIGNYVNNSPHHDAKLLLTNPDNNPIKLKEATYARVALPKEAVSVCPHGGLDEKLRWVLKMLASERPARVFIFTHQHDAAAITAAQPGLAEYYFVHHVDHNPTLGIHQNHFGHIDLLPFSFHHCRCRLGVKNNIYIPLQNTDFGAREHDFSNVQGRGLTTATSGSDVKFSRACRYPYPQVIAQVLAATGGRHVHIGRLPADYLEEIHDHLSAGGIDPERFQYVKHVPSVWRALDKHGIDLYLDSFPIGGAKASAETMGSATPIIGFRQSPTTAYRDRHLLHPEMPSWLEPAELVELLRAADAEWLQNQSRLARRWYETSCSENSMPARFREEPIAGFEPPPSDDISFDACPLTLSENWLRARDTAPPA